MWASDHFILFIVSIVLNYCVYCSEFVPIAAPVQRPERGPGCRRRPSSGTGCQSNGTAIELAGQQVAGLPLPAFHCRFSSLLQTGSFNWTQGFFRGRSANRVPSIGRTTSQPILQLSWTSCVTLVGNNYLQWKSWRNGLDLSIALRTIMWNAPK
jgi:hypothetical protein